MYQGIFEALFPGETLREKLAGVSGAGFTTVQFNLESAGLELVPEDVPAPVIEAIRKATSAAGATISSLAGTYNMIDPDREKRQLYHARLRNLVTVAPALPTPVITVCTGTRDTESMWKRHPDNDTPEAWADLLSALDELLATTAGSPVKLGIEPEPANVVRNARIARQLLDELADSRLGIILDPANIVAGDHQRPPGDQLNEAFDLLGEDIVLAHGKDVDSHGEFCAVGTGVVPWLLFADLLQQSGYDGAVIMHSLTVDQVAHASETLASAGIPVRPE